jgi:hypothetical protein
MDMWKFDRSVIQDLITMLFSRRSVAKKFKQELMDDVMHRE